MPSPIAFALDFPTLDNAESFVRDNKLVDHLGAVKVGLELFIASGPRAVQVFSELSIPVILDLKLHDIPETVARAVKTGGDLGVKYMTLHLQQRKALELAVKAAEPFGIQLLGVTVLTSMELTDFKDLSYGEYRVYRLVQFGLDCGLTGFVCSPKEAAGVRSRAPEAFLLVPGVRPAGAEVQDQKRVGTPSQAVRDGANLIVVGRPIRDAPNPEEAARAIVAECSAG